MHDIPIRKRVPELELAIRASMEAGNATMYIYSKKFETSIKSDNSPVTEADLKSNEIIKELLSPSRHHILSEEDKDDPKRLQEETVWIVDPLDGTADFVDKTGEFTVMIALVRNKKPILGVINWPAEKTVFAAHLGSGAFRYSDGQWHTLKVTRTQNIKECRAVGSRHHQSERERKLVRRLGIKKFTSIGSSLKVGKVSSGQAEAYIAITDKMKEWDTAASHCIIHEAGGRMTDMLGNDITYNNQTVTHKHGILVTNGLIHKTILDEFAILD